MTKTKNNMQIKHTKERNKQTHIHTQNIGESCIVQIGILISFSLC